MILLLWAKYQYKSIDQPLDVIIVPGYPIEVNHVDKWLLDRIYWSEHLFNLGKARNIIYSGSSVYTPFIEATAMKEYGKKIGILADHILEEKRAEHTIENLMYGYELAKENGFEKIGFATGYLQTLFLKFTAPKELIDNIVWVPIIYNLINPVQIKMSKEELDIAKNSSFVSLKSRETFAERMKGTFGKKLKSNY